MRFNSVMVALGGLIGLSGMAMSMASKADEVAQVDAKCVKCHLTIYPNGGPIIMSCASDPSPSDYGAVYCAFTGPGQCYTGGYGSCS